MKSAKRIDQVVSICLKLFTIQTKQHVDAECDVNIVITKASKPWDGNIGQLNQLIILIKSTRYEASNIKLIKNHFLNKEEIQQQTRGLFFFI